MSPRHRRTPVLSSVALLALVVAGCGSSGGTKKTASGPGTTAAAGGASGSSDATATTVGSTGGGSGGGAGIDEDPAHRVVLVNLHLAGSAAGPPFDAYQVPQGTQGLTPVVRDLKYGTVSDPVHLGRKHSSFDTGAFGLTVVPSGGTTTDESAVPFIGSTDWKTEILVIGGTDRAMNFGDFPDSVSGTGSRGLPIPPSGKVTLVASTDFLGDANAGTAPAAGSILFGTPGKCLTSSAPAYATDTLPTPVGAVTSFAVPAGTTTVGFWTTTAAQPGADACTGTPLVTTDVSRLAAGARAVVLPYGPSKDKPSALVVPLPV